MNTHPRTTAIALMLAAWSSISAQLDPWRNLIWEMPAKASTDLSGAALDQVPALKSGEIDLEKDGLPVHVEVLPLNKGSRIAGARVVDAEYTTVSGAELRKWPWLNAAGVEPEVHARVSYQRKQPHLLISVVPFRRNPNTGSPERLQRFRYEWVESNEARSGSRKNDYPDHSMLQTGDWYRFTVAKDGVYRITYDFLRQLGVNVSGLASDQLNVYGNNQGLLPFVNSIPVPTDLKTHAVEVVDGGDGSFGSGDYLLFYANGPLRWTQNGDLFSHTKHVYTDSATYFIGIDVEPPVRIATVISTDDAPTQTVTRFNERQVIDRDLVNLIKSGRTWFAEAYDLVTTYSYGFDVPNLAADVPVTLDVCVAARTYNSGSVQNYSSFSINSTSGFSGTLQVQGITNSPTGAVAREACQTFTWNSGGNNLPITVTFNKFDPVSSVGWMNYLRLNCVRELRMSGDQLPFRSLASVGPGEVSDFVIDQAQQAQRIWDITDPASPLAVQYATTGNQKTFRLATESLREFIAFRDANYLSPTVVGRVPNQDLHATTLPTDLVIVSPQSFLTQAQRVADRRISEGLTVKVVTPQQVFNEFSGGMRDATAIKRYMRMLYDRAGDDAPELLPRYLLLFGDGSYNNISMSASNQNIIPSYQTADAVDFSKSYTSDDYFGLLDENEGEGTGDLVDIGVGRIITHTAEQARQVVDKILGYDALRGIPTTGGSCGNDGDGGIADWRTHVLFVSDDQTGDGFEGVIHMDQSDSLARRVDREHPNLNVDKIYLDAYQQVATPGGQRYPQATIDLRDKVQKGALVVNYIGHGGEVGWAHERLLDNTTILEWSNKDRLPIFMTATCEFSRWDDPGRTSAGEFVLLNPSGGGVALMTTTRLAYSSQNFKLANFYYDHIFEPLDELGREARIGDAFRYTKRDIATEQPNLRNHRNFSLLGDPSMRMANPRKRIEITALSDTLGQPIDTLKALSVVRITGFVDDGNGQPMQDFNGVVVPIVYDKQTSQNTLSNDGGGPFAFKVRKNVIYRGRASVTNGSFSFTFVVPKDINYQFGKGRVACYAESLSDNASGYDNDPIVGGTSDDAPLDGTGPRIEVYLNDERFVRGGITNETPLLFAKIFDENGINTVGSSIGHDLLATLDENTEQAIVLNDLYESDMDTYKSGQVRYRFGKLADGPHTLTVKAWDTHNNSSEKSTEFVVASSAELALAHVLNYPNPFTTRTEFYFEHNRPCNTLEAQVQVFTVSGRLVKTLNRRLTCDGFRTEPLAWDGRDDFGDNLGRGVYVYRLSVAAPDGAKAEQFEKLVILR
ncbi:MAG: type IX secretion system sortase PorU [Flavobacteriales bacterium]|nr:type IX secretion system sortase PorU [Flavobacteriales bacterium]